jgi:hypothetical protein
MPAALAAAAAADPAATCKQLASLRDIPAITPRLAAHTLGGLVQPKESSAIRKQVADYLEYVIQAGNRIPIIHELYTVLLVLHSSDIKLRKCASAYMLTNAPKSQVCKPHNMVCDHVAVVVGLESVWQRKMIWALCFSLVVHFLCCISFLDGKAI